MLKRINPIPIKLSEVIPPDVLKYAPPKRLARMLMLDAVAHSNISAGWPVHVESEQQAIALGFYSSRIGADLIWQSQMIDIQHPLPAWPRVAILEPKP